MLKFIIDRKVLKEKRLAKKMSRAALAKAGGFPKGGDRMIYELERGTYEEVTSSTLGRLALGLNCSIDKLVTPIRVDDPTTNKTRRSAPQAGAAETPLPTPASPDIPPDNSSAES